RKARRYQRVGPIRDRQAFQKLLEREVLLLEKCDVFFEWHAEIFTGALRRSLSVRPAHGFFPAFHWGCAWRGKKQPGHETANNCAVKSFVVRKVSQDWVTAPSTHRQLHRAFAQSFLQFVEIEIVPAARIANNDNRLRCDPLPGHGPQILVVIQSGSVTNRAAVEFPGARRGNNDQYDDNSDAAPWNLRDRALELERWPAVYALGFRRRAEKQTRQPK